MQHEPTFLTLDAQVAALNHHTAQFEPIKVLEFALQQVEKTQIALVSSFGTESIVLLHMVSILDRNLPVLFIDTQMLFKETLTYQTDVARQLGLSDVRRIRPDHVGISRQDPNAALYQHNKDACCALRKTLPLQTALEGFGAWITGRKRFQSGSRAALEFFENDGDKRVKINPLAHWQPQDLQRYIEDHDLPKHPLLARGFASVGCAPCTSPVKDGEDSRAGRWRDSDKTECGIHFSNGKIQRPPVSGELSS